MLWNIKFILRKKRYKTACIKLKTVQNAQNEKDIFEGIMH